MSIYRLVHSVQMGYANPTQIGKGIHLRQYSRAFIIADAQKASRVVFVNADVCMGTQIMKIQVSSSLKDKLDSSNAFFWSNRLWIS